MSELILNTSEEAAEVQTAEEPQQETRSEQQKQERPEVEGILEIVEENDFGFLRFNNFLTSEKDIYVSPTQIRRFHLKTGDKIRGITRLPNPGEKFGALLYVLTVNGDEPGAAIRSRSTGGKSILFDYLIGTGYVCGILSKILAQNFNLAFWFYFPNLIMVTLDIILYYRNKKLEEAAKK